MAPEEARQDIEDLLEAHKAMGAVRGYYFSSFEWLATKDPDFERARQEMVRRVYTPQNPVLPVKYRELIAAAILAYRNYASCEKHLRRALREGASMQEVIEAMEVASIPGGMPLLHFALDELMKIEADGEGAGDSAPPSSPTNPPDRP